MNSRHAVARWLAAPLILAFLTVPAATLAPASASACGGAVFKGGLDAVAATSASDAWAVGGYSTSTVGRALIEHWNGTQWCRVPSPQPGTSDGLTGVAAISPTDAWAVGTYGHQGLMTPAGKPLVLHWDGTSWTQATAPFFGGFSGLGGVSAVSATNAWAVGSVDSGSHFIPTTLILHWNGTTWTRF